MRIARVDVFQKSYTIAGGTFSMSGGKSATVQDATIVRLQTDDGLVGWGEQCGFSLSPFCDILACAHVTEHMSLIVSDRRSA